MGLHLYAKKTGYMASNVKEHIALKTNDGTALKSVG